MSYLFIFLIPLYSNFVSFSNKLILGLISDLLAGFL